MNKRCPVVNCEEEASRFGIGMPNLDNLADTETKGPYCLTHLHRLLDLFGGLPAMSRILYFHPEKETT